MNLGPVGSVLLNLLEHHRVTTAQLARKLGVPDSTISRILREERGLSLEMLNLICDTIGASRSEAFADCLVRMRPGIDRESKEFRQLASALRFLDRRSSQDKS